MSTSIYWNLTDINVKHVNAPSAKIALMLALTLIPTLALGRKPRSLMVNEFWPTSFRDSFIELIRRRFCDWYSQTVGDIHEKSLLNTIFNI